MIISEPLTLRLYPDPILSQRCLPVACYDAALRDLAHAMLVAMREEHGVGLAANQVGVSTRLFVMSGDVDDGGDRIIVNPEILSRDGVGDLEEGCLSLPGLRYRLDGRAELITLRYQDLNGSWHVENLHGIAALCVQHEIDHLDGITMIERLSPLKAGRARVRLIKERKKKN